MQLQRLAKIVVHVGFCVRYVLRDAQQAEAIVRSMENLRRGLDVLWLHRGDNGLYLLVLLPFSGQSAVEGYLRRVETQIQESCPNDWEKVFQRRDALELDGRDAVVQIRAFLEEGDSP